MSHLPPPAASPEAPPAEGTAVIDELLGPELRRRQNAPLAFKLIAGVLPLFALATAFYPVPDNWGLGLFLWAIVILAFATLPASRSERCQAGVPWYDWLAIIAATGSIGYYIFAYEHLNFYIGAYQQWQYVVMAVAILLCLEAARRATGFAVPLIGIALIGWAYHQGFPETMILTRIYVGESGMFGTLTDIFMRYVFLFFIFGALMERAGAADFLRRYLHAVTGRVTAGAAKAAVVGSGAMGMMMGSSAGNVAVTGTLTIPMMKKEGYPARKAAGIETAGSLGGELSPPIMGSAIFLLVAYTATPYLEVVVLSALPAVLYYLAVYMLIHFEGMRDNRRAPGGSSGEKGWRILWDFKHLAIPPVVLIGLIVIGFSPTYGAAGGIVSGVVLGLMMGRRGLPPWELARALCDGTLNFIKLGATAPVLAIILVIVLLTGLPTIATNLTISLTGGQIYLVLIGVFFLALGLGMGMPIVAAYMILATVVAPALTIFDIPLVTAHLVILWFAQTAAITPPVGLASYVAAGIAGTSMWSAAAEGMRLAIAMFALPILMIYGGILSPDLSERFWAFAQIALGLTLWCGFVAGFVGRPLSWRVRPLLLVPIVGMMTPYLPVASASFAVGLLGLVVLLNQHRLGSALRRAM